MIEVRRGAGRFRTVAPGLDSRHSFSFGRHYDPDNLGFSVLMAHNEDRLLPGAGFDRHAHRGLDIVTWVLSGTLEHEHWIDNGLVEPEPTVSRERLTEGMAQVLRTGSGVNHAEHAAASSAAHYVQMWLASAEPTADPGYERRDFSAALTQAATAEPPGMVTVASGRADTAAGLALSQPEAELAVAWLPDGAEFELPVGPFVHVFIARGELAAADGTRLAAGDALRLRDAPRSALVVVEASEILVWTLPPS